MTKTFRFMTLPMGSGWMSGHVWVDERHSWPEKPNGNRIILNSDTQNFEEFSAEIDRLIHELELARSAGKKAFATKP